MSDSITVTGLVATAPKHIVTSEGLPITSFRLAAPQRRFDRQSQQWVDGDTNWYTVTAFRRLAVHTVGSVFKGQRVLVTGRLRVREWQADEKSGIAIEIDADALGHDLTFGTSAFTRAPIATAAPDTPESAAEGAAVPEAPAAPEPEVAPGSASADLEASLPF